MLRIIIIRMSMAIVNLLRLVVRSFISACNVIVVIMIDVSISVQNINLIIDWLLNKVLAQMQRSKSRFHPSATIGPI